MSQLVKSQHVTSKLQASRALDAANFFLADVRDGLGPYLAVYLLTEQKWDEAHIGILMSVATIAGIFAQTPAGALVDATRAKRLVMVGAALIVTLASLLLPLFPSFWPVAISQGSRSRKALRTRRASSFRRRSRPYRSVWSVIVLSPPGLDATRASITRATRWPRRSRAERPTNLARRSCSTYWP